MALTAAQRLHFDVVTAQAPLGRGRRGGSGGCSGVRLTRGMATEQWSRCSRYVRGRAACAALAGEWAPP